MDAAVLTSGRRRGDTGSDTGAGTLERGNAGGSRKMTVRPRTARPANPLVNILKSLGYTGLLWALCFVALPAAIYGFEELSGLPALRFDPGSLRFAAVALFTGGALVGFWSGYLLVTLGEGTPMPLEAPRRLVIAGPYRWIRNPMAIMGILQGIAVGVFLGSILVIVYALIGAGIWHWVLRPWEEQDLRERFGEAYERYRQAVPCWRPRWTPYREEYPGGPRRKAGRRVY
jgi:protein-S-isoprenylcysteine O-methyltransferase Ste14